MATGPLAEPCVDAHAEKKKNPTAFPPTKEASIGSERNVRRASAGHSYSAVGRTENDSDRPPLGDHGEPVVEMRADGRPRRMACPAGAADERP